MMYNSYHSFAYDLGLFTEAMQSGTLFVRLQGLNQLAVHFSPILYTLVPIFKLFPHPQTLLVAQIVILAAAGPLIYYLARQYKLSTTASLYLELLYYICPLTWGMILFDFHEICFAPFTLLLLIIGLMKRKWWLFTLGLILSLCIKEDVTLTLGVLGVCLLLSNRKKVGLIVLISSLIGVGVIMLTSLLLSKGMSPQGPALLVTRFTYLLSPSPFLGWLHTFFSLPSLVLIIGYLLPFLFLPLGTILWALPGLAILAIGMSSDSWAQHTIILQYGGAAIAYFFTATIITITKHPKFMLPIIMVAASIGIMLATHITPFYTIELPNIHTKAIDQTLSLIPKGSSVTASDDLFTHLVTVDDTYVPIKGLGVGDTKYSQYGFPDKLTEYVVVCKWRPQADWDTTSEKTLPTNYTLISSIDGTELWRLK